MLEQKNIEFESVLENYRELEHSLNQRDQLIHDLKVKYQKNESALQNVSEQLQSKINENQDLID